MDPVLEAFAAVGAIIEFCRQAAADVAAVGWQLGASIAAAGLLAGLALRAVSGGAGSIAYVFNWIFWTGLVLAALTQWPQLADETYQVADEVAMRIGGVGVGGISFIQQGWSLFLRIVVDTWTDAAWFELPQMLARLLVILPAALTVLVTTLLLSAYVAMSLLQFWVGVAALPIVLPFTLVAGLSNIGLMAISFMISATVRLIVLSVILGATEATISALVLDGEGDFAIADVYAVALVNLVVLLLVWLASSWASNIAKASPGGTGVSSLVGGAGYALARSGGGFSAGGSGGGSSGGGGGARSSGALAMRGGRP